MDKSADDRPYEEPLGGSYVVDKTGKRIRKEFTAEAPPVPEPVAAPEPAADPAPATPETRKVK